MASSDHCFIARIAFEVGSLHAGDVDMVVCCSVPQSEGGLRSAISRRYLGDGVAEPLPGLREVKFSAKELVTGGC